MAPSTLHSQHVCRPDAIYTQAVASHPHRNLCRGRGRAVNSQPHHHPPQHSTEQASLSAEQSPLGRSPSGRAYASANHLLNFQHYSHGQHGRDSRGFDGRGRGGFRKSAAKPMPYNRNKFLQANFRFLVSDAGNLQRHEAEADLMLDWDDVVQVRCLLPATSM